MPLPVISIDQMRQWEKATWDAGQTEEEVIRRVGKAVAEQALAMTGPDDRILILAGAGNNGQDALRAGEHIPHKRVDVLQVIDPAGSFAELETLLASRPALVIDGLFGIGLNRPLSAPWIQFIGKVNSVSCRVLAVDVPSGLDADTGQTQGAAIRADVTLTVGAPKNGMLCEPAWEYVGHLEVASDVGLASALPTSELQWTLPEDFRHFPPARRFASHKGTYGHLAILAGSKGFHGAAVLAAHGAQRAQPGLITLHTLESAYPPIAGQLQAVMVAPWHPETDLARPWSALLVGPGLAAADVPEELKAAARDLWRNCELPVIVDASALDWLPPGVVPEEATRVITPHPGEAARLLKSTPREVQENRTAALRELSRRFGNTWVVLKGHQTLIGRSVGEMYANPSGNPRMAQGGAGDLLAGYIGGLIAQPLLQGDPLTLLRYAVWQHGHAADQLSRARSNWIVEDLAAALGGS